MLQEKKTLNDIPTGEKCIITKVHGYGGFRHRVMELGFIKGSIVTVVKNAPLDDPIEYKILNSYISLRRSEARNIEVVDVSSFQKEKHIFNGTISEEARKIAETELKTIHVALVGNPNSGKTSFFNYSTKSREKVGNYSGVTVGATASKIKYKDYTIIITDLPGTYSITEYTPEELYVRNHILHDKPDIILNVIDASNLSRNLFLTTQLIDMNFRMVAALNMYDELETSGSSLDYKNLGLMLGFPFVPTIASKGKGINDVLDTIINVYEDKNKITKHIHINYGNTIEDAIELIKKELNKNITVRDQYSSRYLAIKLIENDTTITSTLNDLKNYKDILKVAKRQRERIERENREDTETVITNAKYSFIRGALKGNFTSNKDKKKNTSEKIDAILTNKWLGLPILIIFLWLMFECTFMLGEYPKDWIQAGIDALTGWLSNVMHASIFKDFLIDGIISGVGGVIVFLPNILILFLFISIMEDTGYMARASFMMDKLMHKIGLHGRSFIPLLSGFGCSVPAIMATRTLENKKDRILTMLAIPFMSCSAKLPVYILIIGTFFHKNQGLILLGIYFTGIIIAIFSTLLLRHSLFKKSFEDFVIELPPYRNATLRNTIIHMWTKAKQYLKKMATVILAASAIIWFLGYFPRTDVNKVRQETNLSESVINSSAYQQEHSYIGNIGKTIEPIMEPLGFDWKMSVAILTGFSAKEVVISTMGVLYNVEENVTNKVSEHNSLQDALVESKYTSGPKKGQNVFSPLVALSFLMFILLYSPCLASITAIGREAGQGWALFTFVYNTAVAWFAAFALFQIGSLFL